MPWKETSVMDARVRFVADVAREHFSVSELCRRHGISRKVGYKWLRRYQTEGVDGLKDHSRRPQHSPHATPEPITDAILKLRRRRPHWGARKLLNRLQREHPRWTLPHPTTAHELLKRHGLVPAPRRRTRRAHPGRPTTPMTAPNEIWTADFKGQFKTRNGLYCYPLTIQDGFSRYLLGCRGLLEPTTVGTRRAFERLFRQYGLPLIIRTDNGTPFASHALGRLSSLSVWWVRLGIFPELIEPASPHQNGRHERMHRTLKKETAIPPAPNLRAQQQRFDRFRHEFNEERPHEALGQRLPSELYSASARPFPRRLPPLVYPAHYEVRLVSNNGGIRWGNKRVPVSHLLAQQYVGLEEVDDGRWVVYFGPVVLGWFEERELRIVDHRGRWYRRPLSPMYPD